ncbi:MAG: carbohydrate binding domain-containing protein, partial [Firmicutes bacterium]|nr:carbohydrate binding domain-containing protein [Bacillota bacterium]
ASLTTITITGANDVSVEFDADFNFLTGVTATGNNGQDFTSSITLSSISTAVNTTSGVLDTTRTGLHTVQYRVQSGTIVATKFRNVTVEQPESTGGMLLNPDFALGTAGWTDPGVVYNESGSSIAFDIEEGALKVVVVASPVPYAPRFGQMNVPFEIDTTYEVSFRAKSSVVKPINLNAGELLTSAPWFTDFKPGQPEIRTIGTEWATYSYIFTHRLDNKRGGILFELGTVSGQKVDATMYFDDITIEEATAGPDVTAPNFSGVSSTISVLVGSTYDPLNGVTALDVVDGDLTDSILVEILDSNNAVVNAVDTSVPAVYTVNYSVEDAAGNEATAQTTVNVVNLAFKDENLLRNGSFIDGWENWDTWSQNWGNAPVVDGGVNFAQDLIALTITGGGDAVWAIQMFQENVNLVEGTTYRLSVKAYASVARKISVGIGYGDPWNEYARKNGLELGTTSSIQDFVFTVTKASAAVKVVLELGTQDGFANGTIYFEEVRLQRLDAAPLLSDSKFTMTGWRHFINDWDGTVATSGIVAGEYKMTITKTVGLNPAADNWKLQIIQDNAAFGEANDNGRLNLAVEKSYTLSFDMYASQNINVTTFIGAPGVWVNYVPEANRVNSITTSKQTITIPVSTVGATLNGKEKLSFEFGSAFSNFESGNEFVAIDNVVLKEGNTVLPNVINGDMNAILGGHTFFTENGGAMTRGANGGASIEVPALGGAAYQPHYYYIFPTLAKGSYEVKIALTSSVTRDLRFNIILPDAGYASILPENFVDFGVTADTPYVLTVSFEVVNPLTNVKLELDLGTLGGGKISLPGTFLISEVLVYQNYNS